MKRIFVLLIIAIVSSEILGLNLRPKRQNDETEEEGLEDRYQLIRPNENQFPGQIPLFPGPGQIISTQAPNNSNGNGQSIEQAIRSCIQSCPVTGEFNPVCGSDRVQYTNPGSLICARTCGVNVNLWRQAPCPSQTTASPV